MTHISNERSNVDFSLLLFGINFESRLTRKKASQAKKCAQLCVMLMCKICPQIYKKRTLIVFIENLHYYTYYINIWKIDFILKVGSFHWIILQCFIIFKISYVIWQHLKMHGILLPKFHVGFLYKTLYFFIMNYIRMNLVQ